MIADAQEDRSALTFHRDLDCRSRCSVAYRVSNNILNRTAYQLRHARYRTTLIHNEPHGSVLPARFEVAIRYDFLHEVRKIKRLAQVRVNATVDSRQSQQLTDQLVETLGLDTGPGLILDRFPALPVLQKTQRHDQPRERRAQLV